MKTTLIILRGNSGSGKTTVAQQLQRELGPSTLLISQDVLRREMLGVKDGPHCLAIGLIEEIARYGKGKVETVIIEGIMYTDWYGMMLKELALDFEACFCYYFDLPFEETLKRHQTKINRAEFGEARMRDWWQEKDYLEIIGEETITEDESAVSIVKRILARLKGSFDYFDT